jgi:hypothetical protein
VALTITPGERECAEQMPVRLTPSGYLPPGAPTMRQLAAWKALGWIDVIGEPRVTWRWALTPSFLARTGWPPDPEEA